MPTGLAACAFALSFMGMVTCQGVKFISTSGFDEPISVHFGFWSHESVGFYHNSEGDKYMVLSCSSYEDYWGHRGGVDIDPTWKAAAAMSILPLIFGGVAFLWMCAAKCKLNHLFDIAAFGLAFICQNLSLLILHSNLCNNNSIIQDIENTPFRSDVTFEDRCSLSTGMNCIIAATVLWFLALLCSIDAYSAKKEDEPLSLTQPLINNGAGSIVDGLGELVG